MASAPEGPAMNGVENIKPSEAPPIANGQSTGPNAAMVKASENVLYSDIGITVLLGRLKQSIASARDFSVFLKRRSSLEEEHAAGLRKISRLNYEAAQKSENRAGSYATQMNEITRSHERVADNGHLFAEALLQIHDELNELSNNMERSRKQWKEKGLSNEKRVKDAELLMDKAKAKYDSSADSYDRVRTGEGSGRSFGIKGPKSAEQREEDLKNKMHAADSDYAAKVQAAQSSRQENLTRLRPQAIQALQDLIRECDNALSLQLQRFAAFNEKLLVSNGMVVSPLRGPSDPPTGPSSMRETISKIDNERDFHTYVTSHSSSVPSRSAEIKYEKHPTQASGASPPAPTAAQTTLQTGFSNTGQSPTTQGPGAATLNSRPGTSSQSPQTQTFQQQQQQQRQQTPDRTFKGAGPQPPPNSSGAPVVQSPKDISPQQPQYPTPYGPPKASAPPNTLVQPPAPAYPGSRSASGPGPGPAPSGAQQRPSNGGPPQPPPYNRVFGLSLDELYRRDDTAVPVVINQCIQAVDMFGLDVEGIYRTSGNTNHINALRAKFDYDSSKMDFRNPENFHHDVSDAAGLLKQFLRDLPDPLFPREQYADFIKAAKIDDDTQRRDSLHAIINSLPDPNYATLRAIILHLWRVHEHEKTNRMTTSNLALCLAPTLMGQQSAAQIADAGLQARTVDTILQNTYQIFDED